ncbi:MAG: macro domain-containing protein [Candidatus Aminicenantes bacterium]|nr:macro domain-containing protein [Candidatus Aminicenantes bacterium]
MREILIDGKKLKILEGDIVRMKVDAIVNAANKSLVLGGGVAGAIRRAGGPSIQEECDRIGPINTGEAALTGGGNLEARFVIHAAGPVYGEGNEDAKLRMATISCLNIAFSKKMKSIAFPAISTGIYRFPIEKCSEIMITTAKDFLGNHEYPREIIFCLYGQEAYAVFERTFLEI